SRPAPPRRRLSTVSITFLDENVSPAESFPLAAKIPTPADLAQATIDPTDPSHVPLNLLELAHQNSIELEGACGGELACSTCHCLLPEDLFEELGEMEEEEEDMLDLAYGRVEGRSRLGCQVKIDGRLDGRTFVIPEDPY
ncbi:hypothetical protein TeGR_g13534, partial [Tetraparma gracilis]